MDYKIFDNNPRNEYVYNKVIELLKNKPMTKEELMKEVGCSKNVINPQMYKMTQHSLIDKKHFEGKWYYGLRKDKRN